MKQTTFNEFFSGKKILITGGLGMIGSNLAIALVKLNGDVTLLNKSPGNLFNIQEIKNKIKLVIGDVTDKITVARHVKGKDIIFHLAAKVSQFPLNFKDVIDDININRLSHLLMLESLRKYNDKAVIIFPGSRLEYGRPRKIPVNETAGLEPISFYGIDKVAAENYYSVYNKTYGIKTVCFRITNPYGPRGQMKSGSFNIVNWFIRKALNNEAITIYGNGEQLRDYIYIEDLVDGLLIITSKKKAIGEIFNIGSGKAFKFKDMARLIVQIAGQGSIEYRDYPATYKILETSNFVADVRKRKKLGWNATTSRVDGIKRTIAYYKVYKQYYW